LPGWRVEQVRQSGIGFEPDLIARFEVVAFAENRDDILVANLGDDLQLGAGRLDDEHLGFTAILGDDEMPGRPSLPVGAATRGKRTPLAASNCRAPFLRIVPLRKFIAGEPMKPATKRLRGRS